MVANNWQNLSEKNLDLIRAFDDTRKIILSIKMTNDTGLTGYPALALGKSDIWILISGRIPRPIILLHIYTGHTTNLEGSKKSPIEKENNFVI